MAKAAKTMERKISKTSVVLGTAGGSAGTESGGCGGCGGGSGGGGRGGSAGGAMDAKALAGAGRCPPRGSLPPPRAWARAPARPRAAAEATIYIAGPSPIHVPARTIVFAVARAALATPLAQGAQARIRTRDEGEQGGIRGAVRRRHHGRAATRRGHGLLPLVQDRGVHRLSSFAQRLPFQIGGDDARLFGGEPLARG